MNTNPAPRTRMMWECPYASAAVLLLLFLAAALAVFHVLLSPGAILMSTDDNVGLLASTRQSIETSVFHPWSEALWGMPAASSIRPGFLLLKCLSPVVYMNIFHGLCLMLAAWFLALYLKGKQLHPAACIFGGLVAFWVGTNLTLTYAGHIGKYAILVFCALAIWALGCWGTTGRRAWGIVAGAAAGAMFLEQGDVALFCAILLVPLGFYEWLHASAHAAAASSTATPARRAFAAFNQLWPAALVGGSIALGASLANLGAGTGDAPAGQSPEEHWSFITQWSQPPEESLDFIAPGWTGWRSYDEQGPYWGRMGRSDGWEQTRQGFQNFKLENVYVGALPLLFALIALAEAFRRRRENPLSPLVFLWGGLCLLALLLAFGKYTPLYRPFSMLPGINAIRNPNKFIHFFQIAWGVLAAFGLDAASKMNAKTARRWAIAALGGAALFGLGWLALLVAPPGAVRQLSLDGFTGGQIAVIQRNKGIALLLAAAAFAIGALVMWIFHTVEKSFPMVGKKFSNGWKKSAAPSPDFPQCGKKFSTLWKTALLLPVCLVVFDAAIVLAPHYIQTMPSGYIAENELVKHLKQELGPNRSAMAGQDGFYNLWLTYLFPYQGIATVNVTQLPRPPADYAAFWQAVRDPLQQWRLAAVSHILAPGGVAAQLMANPAWAQQLELDWAYQPYNGNAKGREGAIETRPIPVAQAARSLASTSEVVLKLKTAWPRVAAAGSWRTAPDNEALARLGAWTQNDFVFVAPEAGIPDPPVGVDCPPPKVDLRRVQAGRYNFTVEKDDCPAIIRVAEKYDASWKAVVNGKAAPVVRVDYMFQGIYLPEEAGTYEAELRYAPSSMPVMLQGAGLLAGLAAAAWLLLSTVLKRKTTDVVATTDI